MQVRSLGWEDPMEEEMATSSSILAWEIPWTEEPGGPQTMGSQSETKLSVYTCTHVHMHKHTLLFLYREKCRQNLNMSNIKFTSKETGF